MSFRDNLQHLRATRNMTQEQLAMLLGVSRQSVTKWEAEKSYPEMDKLLKMCQIFECSLDDLVQGDLTSRPKDPVAAAAPAGPPTDICGYDEHMRRFAWQISAGVALILLGVALAALVGDSAQLLDGSIGDTLAAALLFLGILGGCACIIPAGVEHDAFAKAHPYIEDFYSTEDKAAARRLMTRCLIVGIGMIFAGVIACDLLDDFWENAAGAAILAFIAVGAGSIVYGGIMYSRTNLVERNREVLDDIEAEDIMAAPELSPERREELLAAKRDPRTRKESVQGAVCGIIMLVATIIALCWMFGVLPADADPAGGWGAWGRANLFWLPWPIGGICCGIACIAIEAFWRE